MQYMFSTICILMTTMMLSCGNKPGDGGGDQNGNNDSPKTFSSATDAANAAKQDMIAAADKGAVNFGVDKEKLRIANPGTPLMHEMLRWDALLQGKIDSARGAGLKSLAAGDPVTMVPLIAGTDVITIVGLRGGDKGRYEIGSLGNKQISDELDAVMKASGGGEVHIYEVPNLQATIYGVTNKDGMEMYYTAYNGASIRQGMDARGLLPMLQREATEFQRQFGDQMKKGPLVR